RKEDLDGLVHHSDRGVRAGINWSSQHLDREGVAWDDREVGRRQPQGGHRCAHRDNHPGGRRWPLVTGEGWSLSVWRATKKRWSDPGRGRGGPPTAPLLGECGPRARGPVTLSRDAARKGVPLWVLRCRRKRVAALGAAGGDRPGFLPGSR